MKNDLKKSPRTVCWRNTNLSPDFYKPILLYAMKYQRFVRFVRWGQEMPVSSISELIKRNVLKFLRTGKYIETTKLNVFLNNAVQLTKGRPTHADYAKKAGFAMDRYGMLSVPGGLDADLPSFSEASWKQCPWRAWTDDTILTPLSTPISKRSSTVNDSSHKRGDSASRDKDRCHWGPVLVTIGPNCSGKTKFVQNVDDKVARFCVDDDPILHENVAVHLVVRAWAGELSSAETEQLKAVPPVNGTQLLDRVMNMKVGHLQ